MEGRQEESWFQPRAPVLKSLLTSGSKCIINIRDGTEV